MKLEEFKNQFTEKEFYPSDIVSWKEYEGFVEIIDTNNLKLQVHFYEDEIIRFRYGIEGYFEPDFSYAIDPKYKRSFPKMTVTDNDQYLLIESAVLTCRIAKTSCSVAILNKDGLILNEDEKGFHWEKNPEHGGHIVQMTKRVKKGEAFYGLGDKPTDLNLKGRRFVNWGTDEYGYHYNTDPIYKAIPVYYGLHQDTGYAIFYDNTYKSYFDYGKERDTVMSFWSQGGEMNYYFIAGPHLMDACKRYTQLTGTPEMPPLWSLGFQQCKWSYYPESKVKEITNKMRELKIPCDAIYLDIDYMDGYRCFTWDLEKFPDPKRMVDELKADGWKTMVIIDPGIKKDNDYWVFKEGLEKGYFCKHADGPHVEGKVWPGECYFPDFTNPEAREWWAGLYKGLIADVGVAGVWNDMNEPALFEMESKTFPLTVMHDYEGNPTSHRKAHNIYGMQMARATAQGVRDHAGGDRSLIITRSGYSGMQRFSSVWTGDNIASWEHLWLADVQAQRLAISGVSFCGSDIGGFIEQPDAELMIRWIQLGIFHPFCRVHSSGDHGDQEPWSFGEQCVEMFRKFVELRYTLLPYLYTTFWQYHQYGLPMLRPIVFYDQEDDDTIDRDHEFLCGDHLLICPVHKSGIKTREVYLPKGQWYNFWTGMSYSGRQQYTINTPIDEIPMFIKAGAIIPRYPIQQYVGELEINEITLDVYYKDGAETSTLYQDDHDTYAYESGDWKESTLSLVGTQDKLTLTQAAKGGYSGVEHFMLNLKHLPFTPSKMTVDGEVKAIDGEIRVSSGFSKLELS